MSRSSGTYTAPSSSVNPAVEGTTIDETDFNALLDDIESALTESVYTSGLGSTDNRLVRTDGTDTKKIKGTGITVDDSDNVSGVAALTATTVNIGNADTTLARSGAGDITVEGNAIYRAGGTDVPVTDGGTGASTAAAGFRALAEGVGSTQGDILYRNGTEWVALAAGTSGHVLKTQGAGANPQWAAETGASGAVATDGIWDAKGDLAVGTGSNTASRLAVGSNGQVLTADSAEATGVKWVTVAGTGDVTATLAFGTDNVIVRSDGTGKGVQSTGISVDDSNNISGVGTIASGNITSSGAVAATTIELGHASDTTLSRDSAGVMAVEGVPVYSQIPQNSQSSAYTLVLSDAQKHILHPTADNNARTFTIPANASVAYPIGTCLTFVNQINTVTIAITSDTLTLAGAGTTGSRTLAANGVATALKIASTSWIISGAGLT